MKKLNKTAQQCVDFANFCNNHKIDPRECAELAQLTNAYAREGERQCNEPDRKADRLETIGREIARKLATLDGWEAMPVSGLYPTYTAPWRDRENVPVHSLPI